MAPEQGKEIPGEASTGPAKNTLELYFEVGILSKYGKNNSQDFTETAYVGDKLKMGSVYKPSTPASASVHGPLEEFDESVVIEEIAEDELREILPVTMQVIEEEPGIAS